MLKDWFGYNENIPEEIREIYMWLCQDLASLFVMWNFYLGLFGNKEDLDILTDCARGSFKIIEEALRTSMVMAICRLNDPSFKYNNQNLSFERLVNKCQDVPEIHKLYTEFKKACKPFEIYRNKRYGHRDLSVVLDYEKDILKGIEKNQVEEVLSLANRIISSVAQFYTYTDFYFSGPIIGDAKSLLFWLKKGLDCQKAKLEKLRKITSKQKNDDIADLLTEIKSLAKKYRELTGKPLGVTGEVAEFSAAKILGLELSDARQPGYDATKVENGKEIKYQIKSRCLKSGKPGVGRLGAIRFKHEWDFALLVLLDEDLEVTRIFEVERSKVKQALEAPGSNARNERGQLSIRQFIAISREKWNRESGLC